MLLFVTKQINGKGHKMGYLSDMASKIEKYDFDSLVHMLQLEKSSMKQTNRDDAKLIVLIKLIMNLVRHKTRVEKDRVYWRLRQG